MPARARGNRRGGVTGRYARQRDRNRRRGQMGQENVPQESHVDNPDSLTGFSDTLIKAGKDFDTAVSEISMNSCENCHQRFLCLPLKNGRCAVCQSDPEILVESNRMWLGEIPSVLKDLTLIEKLLIAQIHPVVSIYRLKGAQYAYKGNVISFVQNIQEYTTVLPSLPSQLSSVIMFSRNTPTGVAEFQARAGHIRAALQWLKCNNDYYRNITISEENLSQLPENGDISSQFNALHEDHEFQDDSDGISNSFVPFLQPTDRTEQVTSMLNLPYPTTEAAPVNEYETDGFFARAFPCLFPYGVGDFKYPRRKVVSIDKYFNYLANYHDRRFVHDQRFCYFAMNIKLRRQAVSCGALFARKASNIAMTTAADLRERVQTNPNFMKQLMVHAASLRSSKPYWKKRCSELITMVQQIGVPTVFFTLSAADYHWNDLMKLLEPGLEPSEISEARRRELMHSNPDIVAYFFKKRCELFIKHVLKPIFKVKDQWYRFEWQWRGSPHIHGLLWLENAPSIDQVSFTDLELDNIRKYYDGLSFAINPHINPSPPVEHPCRKNFSDVDSSARLSDLDQLLNMVQRHTCGERCLRKKDDQWVCRFKFPIETRDESLLEFVDGKLDYYPKRNDAFLGRFNPFITQVWRANTDFSPVTSKDAVLNYIAKYTSKAEKSSLFYKEVLDAIIENADDDLEFKTLISRLFISTISDRDYSSQEVYHILKGWDLYSASRDFITLWVKDEAEWNHIAIDATDQVQESKSLLEKYRERPRELDSLDLLQFSKSWYVTNVRREPVYRQRRKEAVVRVFPVVRLTGDCDVDEEFYRLQVVLRVPFRGNFDSLLQDTSQLHLSWKSRFESLGLELPEILELRTAEEEGQEPETLNELDQQDPGMAAAGMRNNLRPDELLGRRLEDISHEWQSVANYPSLPEVKDFLRTFRDSSVQGNSSQDFVASDVVLSDEQQRVVDICKDQIKFLQGSSTSHDPPKRVVVLGKAGCGKSTIIKTIRSLVTQAFGPNSIEVAALTGVAAINVGGKTVHSLMNIPPMLPFAPLQGESLAKFQEKLGGLKFLVIDEISMLGSTTFGYLEHRCRESRSSYDPNRDDDFGGLMVFCLGDFNQLPPVKDSALCGSVFSTDARKRGKLVFDRFQQFIGLEQCHRQGGEDSVAFRVLLDNVSHGTITDSDYALLMSRRKQVVSVDEQDRFKDAIRLYYSNPLVKKANDKYLRDSAQPVARIVSLNVPNIRDEDSCCLNHVLNIMVGCRVMLRYNLSVEKKLVNGSLGTVRAIVYDHDARPPVLPLYVFVEFDDYKGECFPGYPGLFPIVPISRTWYKSGRKFTRTQLPLNLAHAITIHKAQGLTLSKVILNLGPNEPSSNVGISYVALSRVRRLTDLLIETSFSKERIDKISKMKGYKDRYNFLRSKFGSAHS